MNKKVNRVTIKRFELQLRDNKNLIFVRICYLSLFI